MNAGRFGAAALAMILGGTGLASGRETTARPRKPVALVVADGGRRVYVANQASGTVSVIDARSRAVVAEIEVGRSLADLALTPDGRRLLAVDQGDDRLVVLDRDGDALRVAARVAVARDPASVAVTRDGTRCALASRWSRRLTLVELGPEPKVVQVVELPFGARRQAMAGDGARERLIVSDAFGGGIVVVDPRTGAIESSRTVQAHNIGGLVVSADGTRLLLSQQYLNARADTRADDIHWGFLMTNSVRSIRLDAVLTPGADLVPGGRLDHLGEPGRGAGDPSGLAALPDGRVIVALAGVDEVAYGPLERPDDRRVGVGRGPSAVVAGPDGQNAYVADTLGDAVTVVDLGAGGATVTIPLGTGSRVPSEAELGERLFHDATLSHEGWMSCQSCHADGHASAVLADTLGDGSYGAPKRTLSLLGVAATAPYAWDGHLATLEEQVSASLTTTLRGKTPDPATVRAVSAYLRTLSPAPPVAPSEDVAAVARGRAVFERRRCDRCHAPPSYTSTGVHDVGLADDAGSTRFNPPSLLGVSQRDRLFHDGRACGLEDVFVRFAHPDESEMSERDVADLIAFLQGL